MMRKFFAAAILSVFFAVPILNAAYGGRVRLDRADGIYKVGETAVCKVTLLEDGKPLKGTKARMTIKIEGKEIETRDFTTTGRPVAFSYTGTKPEWAYFGFELLDDNGKPLSGKGVYRHHRKTTIVTEIGALFSPDEIRTKVKRPADFDAFWKDRRAKLDAVPVQPKLTLLECSTPGVKLYAVEVPALGDYPVTGYLAIPVDAKPKNLPAYVDWASWSPQDADRRMAINRAKEGAIGFAPTWHGRPVNMGKSYYNYSTTIKINSGLVGINDRETWCFSGMYYRIMRSLDFVKSLPEWDGKQLISVGGSLGGAQSIAAAALDKDVTLAVIKNPCFCEFDGGASGHTSSIPHSRSTLTRRIANGDRRPLRTCAYFDCVNFAPMIRCKTFICTGGTDELCPPSNVYTVYNAIPEGTEKQMFFNPATGHYGQIDRSVAPHLKKLFDSVKIKPYVE